jgi:hypothetical protein
VGAAIQSGIVGADIQSGSVSSPQGPGHCVSHEFRDKGMWQAWRRFHVPPRIGRDRNVPAVRAMLQTGRISGWLKIGVKIAYLFPNERKNVCNLFICLQMMVSYHFGKFKFLQNKTRK